MFSTTLSTFFSLRETKFHIHTNRYMPTFMVLPSKLLLTKSARFPLLEQDNSGQKNGINDQNYACVSLTRVLDNQIYILKKNHKYCISYYNSSGLFSEGSVQDGFYYTQVSTIYN
jgi:hypothetical protein